MVASRGSSLRLFSIPDARVCWNLPDVFSNNSTAGNITREDSTLFTLDDITYTRSEGAFDTDVAYTQWYVNQYPINGDGNTLAPMQVNIYSESDCSNDTHPYYAHSCRQSAGGHLGDWGGMSISVQPHDVDAATCFYNASNGVEWDESASQSTGNGAVGRAELSALVGGAVIAMGIAVVL